MYQHKQDVVVGWLWLPACCQTHPEFDCERVLGCIVCFDINAERAVICVISWLLHPLFSVIKQHCLMRVLLLSECVSIVTVCQLALQLLQGLRG